MEEAGGQQTAEQQADDDIFSVDLEARKAGLRAQLAAFTKVIILNKQQLIPLSSTCARCVWPKSYLARLACSEHPGKDS